MEEQLILQINYTEGEYNMQQTNMIGDPCKERRIDYDLIDKINKQYEREGRKEELKRRLVKKIKVGNEKEMKEKEKEEHNPATEIKYIKKTDELRDIKGNYSLQKGAYTIDFDIRVPKSCGLILEPGVEFKFTKNAGIICNGRFEAKGKNGLEVLLTAKDKDKGWKNLYLHGNAEGILDYARFSYGRGRMDSYTDICGGAVFLDSENGMKPTISINNSYFEDNSAHFGGALFIKGNAKIYRNNKFEDNSVRLNGGAIYNYQGEITINENNIFENNAARKGGAIFNLKGKLEIDESKNIFKGNKPNDIYWDT